ncbi:hypothetical protein KI387_038585, partial [Taxus chinensis]
TATTSTHIAATRKNQSTDCVEGNIEVDMHSAQYQPNDTYDDTMPDLEDIPVEMPDPEDILPVGVQPGVHQDITHTNTQQNGTQKSNSNSGSRKRKP